MPNAIEEVLRHSPPIMQFGRTATQDFGLQGHHLEHPDCLWFSRIDRYMPGSVFLLGGELWREVIDGLRRLA